MWRLVFITVSLLFICAACVDGKERQQTNETCSDNTDCADHVCHAGICASPTPSAKGQPCSGHGNCKTYNCVNGICAPGTRADGEPCLQNAECQSGRCNTAGRCGPAAPEDAGPDALPLDAVLPDKGVLDLALPDVAGADMPAPGYKILDPKGKKIGGPISGARATNPAVATDGVGFMVAWDNPLAKTADRDIAAALVDKAGNAGAAFKVTKTSPIQTDPALAFDGTNYLVVYVSEGGKPDIHGTRVSAAGKVLDQAGIAIKTSFTPNELYPEVAFDGVNYLVTWITFSGGSGGSIQGKRLTTSLAKVSDVTVGPTNATTNQLAFDGTHHLVAWRQGKYTKTMGARVMTAAGTLVGTSALTYGKTNKGNHPAVAVGPAGKGVIVWEDTSTTGTELSGAVVDLKAGTLGTTGYVMVSGKAKTNPAVVYDGKNYLVVWEEDNLIRGRRIAPGTLKAVDTKSFVISTDGSGGYKGRPVAILAGGQVLVVWEDSRSKTAREIYGARITFGTAP